MKNKKIRGATILVFVMVLVLASMPIDYYGILKKEKANAASNVVVIDDPTEWNLNNAPIMIDNTDYYFNSDLVVKEGVKIILKNKSRIIISGDFIIEGTKNHPVSLAGADEYDNFSISADGERTQISYAYFEKGGYNQCMTLKEGGLIRMALAVDECLPMAALNVSSEDIQIENSTFEKNVRAMNIVSNGSAKLFNNKFLHNDFAIHVDSQNQVQAPNNCWMRPSGPDHENNPGGRGERIEGNINFINWQECGSEFEPVIIIPGIGGSWSWTTMFDNEFSDNWSISLGAYAYENLIQSFRDRGYEENRDFFIALYDWRKDNHESMEQFFKPLLEKIKNISFDEKYDIVAHSMGGYVALDYVYDDSYQGEIDKIVLEGTPLFGSSKAYPVWEGGVLPEDWSIMDIYLRFLYWMNFKQKDNYDLIHEYIPSTSQLLPLYNYIQNNETGEITPAYEMQEQNAYLPILFDKMMNNSNQFSLDNITLIEGTGVETSKIVKVDDYDGENSDKLWKDGKPNPYPLEKDIVEGDGTVLNSSIMSMVPFRVMQIQNAQHGDLPTLALNEMSDSLGIGRPGKEYQLASKNQMIMAFACPVDVKITAPDGSFITKDENTMNGAEYFSDGKDDGFKIISILDPQEGEYKTELEGNGNGHYDALAYKTDGEQSTSEEFSGEIKEREVVNYQVSLTENEVKVNLDQPQDQTPPQIIIISPENEKTYQNINEIDVSYEITDNVSAPEDIQKKITLDAEDYNKNKVELWMLRTGEHEFSIHTADETGNATSETAKFNNVTSFRNLAINTGKYHDLGLIKSKGQTRHIQLKFVELAILQKYSDNLKQDVSWPGKWMNQQLAKRLEKTIELEAEKLKKWIEKQNDNQIDPVAKELLLDGIEYPLRIKKIS